MLGTVLGIDPDMITLADTTALQEVRQLVGRGLQLVVVNQSVADLDGVTIGHSVDGVFEEISDVQAMRQRLEHVLVSD